MTTTAQNTKISPNFPARKSLGKCTVSADPWASPPENLQRRRTKTKKRKTNKKNKQKTTGKPGETSPFCAMNKYRMYIKIKIFSSDIFQKVDVNQRRPT